MPVAGGGMFGVTPQEVYQQQQQGINQSARDIAGMDGFTAAKYAMGQVGGGLAAPVAGMLGMKNPQMEEAQQSQDIQSQIDHSTPKGLMQGAQLFNQAGNPRMAMMYQQAAQAMVAQQAEVDKDKAQADSYAAKANAPAKLTAPPTRVLENDGVKTTVEMQPDGRWKPIASTSMYKPDTGGSAKEDSPFSKINPADFTPESVKAFLASGNYGDLTPVDKTGNVDLKKGDRLKYKQEADDSRGALDSLESDTRDIKSRVATTLGLPAFDASAGFGKVLSHIPGSDWKTVSVLLDAIKDVASSSGLQKMRANGGIGAITEREWNLLAGQIAKIDQSLPPDELRRQVQRVADRADQIFRDAEVRHNRKYAAADKLSYDELLGIESPTQPTQKNVAPSNAPSVPSTLAAPVKSSAKPTVSNW